MMGVDGACFPDGALESRTSFNRKEMHLLACFEDAPSFAARRELRFILEVKERHGSFEASLQWLRQGR